jgi:hypothetical protein
MAKREFGVTAQMRAARKILKQPVITSVQIARMPGIMFQEVFAKICVTHAPGANMDAWVRRDLMRLGGIHG